MVTFCCSYLQNCMWSRWRGGRIWKRRLCCIRYPGERLGSWLCVIDHWRTRWLWTRVRPWFGWGRWRGQCTCSSCNSCSSRSCSASAPYSSSSVPYSQISTMAKKTKEITKFNVPFLVLFVLQKNQDELLNSCTPPETPTFYLAIASTYIHNTTHVALQHEHSTDTRRGRPRRFALRGSSRSVQSPWGPAFLPYTLAK